MAVAEWELTGQQVTSLLADKSELRRLMTEQNKKMGFVRVAGATAQMARARMLAEGVRPEANEATQELKRARYGADEQKA